MPSFEERERDPAEVGRCPATRSISVVIPARNAEATLARTLRSLVPDAEFILEVLAMDDGSTDRTSPVATAMGRLYGLPVKVLAVTAGSAGGSRNRGASRAAGEFIYYLDADDELVPGGLRRLYDALSRNPQAGIAIGANIRRTEGRLDKLKVPHGYGVDPAENVQRYLRNELWPIAMGSGLIRTARLGPVRFPETIGLDEDTCFWAALLARERVVTVAAPVLLYHHDEQRMSARFLHSPQRTLLTLSREFDQLAEFGVGRETLQWRKAWVALRIARQLLMHGRNDEAARILRVPRAHPAFRNGWKVLQYGVRARAGGLIRRHPDGPVLARKVSQPHRTLVVTYDPAWPPVSGSDLRNWGSAVLASRTGPVMLISVRPMDTTAALPDAGVTFASLTSAGQARGPTWNKRRACIEPRISRDALARLVELTRDFRPDSILVGGIPLACLIPPIRSHASLLILDMQNVESDLMSQKRARTNRAGQFKQLLRNDIGRVRRLERRACAQVDRVWVCSECDRERLLALVPPAVVDVVPNGIPRFEETPAQLPPLAPTVSGWPVVLFVGHLGYWPNVDAAQRLVRAILPAMRKRFPRAKVILAGRSAKPAVRALVERGKGADTDRNIHIPGSSAEAEALAGVELIEDPEDLRPLYRRAHLCVVPLNAGGGTRIKIMEAMAWGLPVIATPLAAEGLGLANGIDVLLADSDHDLARLACDLCADGARMEQQRRLAHAWVRLHFGASAIERAIQAGLGVLTRPVPHAQRVVPARTRSAA